MPRKLPPAVVADVPEDPSEGHADPPSPREPPRDIPSPAPSEPQQPGGAPDAGLGESNLQNVLAALFGQFGDVLTQAIHAGSRGSDEEKDEVSFVLTQINLINAFLETCTFTCQLSYV